MEAGDIEAAIRETPGVSDALVLLDSSLDRSEYLVAYTSPANVSPHLVQDMCTSKLPGYMVPSVVVALDVWPLNSSGKVDRKQLPIPRPHNEQRLQTRECPRLDQGYNEMERTVLIHIEDVLGMCVDVSEPLMQAGLSSLAAVRLSHSLQRELGTSVKLPSTLVSSICLALFGC